MKIATALIVAGLVASVAVLLVPGEQSLLALLSGATWGNGISYFLSRWLNRRYAYPVTLQ